MNDKKLKIKTKKYKGSTSVVSLRLPDELISELDKYADTVNRTRNDLITKCLIFALENIEIDDTDS